MLAREMLARITVSSLWSSFGANQIPNKLHETIRDQEPCRDAKVGREALRCVPPTTDGDSPVALTTAIQRFDLTKPRFML